VTAGAVEEALKAWLEERVRDRNIIVSDLELFADGKFCILDQEGENKLFQRFGVAAGND
jgi:hypothetical protein